MTDYVALLAQDEIWIDKAGRTHRLVEMDPDHRANLIPFLRRSAQNLQFLQYTFSALACVEDPSDGVFAAQCHEEAQFMRPPAEWLEDQPLMRKLRELEKARHPLGATKTRIRNRAYRLVHPGYKRQVLK